jgi:hypothetical protein
MIEIVWVNGVENQPMSEPVTGECAVNRYSSFDNLNQ